MSSEGSKDTCTTLVSSGPTRIGSPASRCRDTRSRSFDDERFSLRVRNRLSTRTKVADLDRIRADREQGSAWATLAGFSEGGGCVECEERLVIRIEAPYPKAAGIAARVSNSPAREPSRFCALEEPPEWDRRQLERFLDDICVGRLSQGPTLLHPYFFGIPLADSGSPAFFRTERIVCAVLAI